MLAHPEFVLRDVRGLCRRHVVVTVETENGSIEKNSASRAFFDEDGGLVRLDLEGHHVK